MKLKFLYAAALSLALAGFAQAQTTVINITGSTAFRSAAVASITAAYGGAGSCAQYFANTDDTGAAATMGNSTYQAWKGTFPGITGTTIIRTTWNGSVEGVRALTNPGATNNARYIAQATITAQGIGTSGSATYITVTAGSEQVAAQLAFSDVKVSSTPETGSLSGGPVGIITFTMVANKTWRDDVAGNTAGITSISAQQFRQLASNGSLPLSFFSGNSTHTDKVYLTGRNDGSGTRTTYLAETGFGIANPVRQYVAHDRSSTTTIPKILLTAAGGGFNFQDVATPQYASTIWGFNQDGNGGYSTGADIRSDLSKTTAATEVWSFKDLDESGSYDATEDSRDLVAAKLYLVSWLSVSDAKTAASSPSNNTGAFILGYNGTRLDTFAADVTTAGATGLAAADRAKIVNGSYAAWGYEELFYPTGSANGLILFNQLKTSLNNATTIGAAGLPLGEMNVQRTFDGGTIVPGQLP